MPANNLDIKTWATNRVESMTNEVKGLIDCGMDMEYAVDLAFSASILGMSYKMQVLANVAHYRHIHKFVTDVITGKEWCATCQQFK